MVNETSTTFQVTQLQGTIGIKLNISKCHIGQIKIKFLGHIVSKEGFRPDPGNIEPITQMKAPTNLKEVRRFIGMVGFYRKHIPNFSKIASPPDLTRKNQAFQWTIVSASIRRIKNIAHKDSSTS